ncbi:MAG: IS200/IS605 family transposase [Candidatus Omnitrophota bacterium]
MSHSFVSQHIHCVFSTKNREPWITPNIRDNLYQFIGGIANKYKFKIIAVGGIDNHIHILLSLSSDISLSKAAQLIKGGSTYWIHKTYPEKSYFTWQDGYGAFSIGISQIKKTKEYIANQEYHHRTQTFQEEFIQFLKKHGIQYNENNG